jgi:hypothetical protein
MLLVLGGRLHFSEQFDRSYMFFLINGEFVMNFKSFNQILKFLWF